MQEMLNEGLLAEGGATGINDSLDGECLPDECKDNELVGLEEFDKYGSLFKDLTKRQMIDTVYSVVNIIITFDSKFCIAIVSQDDEHFELQGYSLTTYESTFRK